MPPVTNWPTSLGTRGPRITSGPERRQPWRSASGSFANASASRTAARAGSSFQRSRVLATADRLSCGRWATTAEKTLSSCWSHPIASDRRPAFNSSLAGASFPCPDAASTAARRRCRRRLRGDWTVAWDRTRRLRPRAWRRGQTSCGCTRYERSQRTRLSLEGGLPR